MPLHIFRRTRWLIDPDVQVRLSVRLGACLISYVTLFCLLAIGEPLLVLVGLSSKLGREAAWLQVSGFARAILAPLMFAVACMVLHGVLLMHRLAGPIYRVRRGLGALKERSLCERLHLRKGDYLTSIAGLYNEAVQQLSEDLNAARAEVDKVASAGEFEQAQPHLQRLRAILAQYRLDAEQEPVDVAPDPAEVGAG